jgi:hypothetical protein
VGTHSFNDESEVLRMGLDKPYDNVQPLRELDGGVPPGDPYIVKAANDNQVAVTLNVGDTVLIDSDGTIRNTHGSRLGQLAAQK